MAAAYLAFYAKSPANTFTLYGITAAQYETLINNETEKLRYIRDLRSSLDYYRSLDLK